MTSLWHDTANLPRFPALSRDTSCDVLVIGGGMAGLLTLHELCRRGVDCLLVEAERIGSGTTGGTTAVLSAQHDTLYADLIRSFGRDQAKAVLYANLSAVEQYRALCARIPCDFSEAPSCLYTLSSPARLEREASAVQSLGFPARFTQQTELPLPVRGAVFFPGMAQFHPLRFLAGLVPGLPICENTRALRIEPGAVHTNRGVIRARRVIVCTHFPILNRRGLYFMKQYQMRSFVLALKNAPALHGTYAGTERGGLYFRSYGDLLLVGGGDHRTGKSGGGFDCVEAFVRRTWPQARVAYRWAAQDCMSLDGVPYIGPYSPHTPGLFVATGFNEWGMTTSMVASRLLADAVTGQPNPYARAFAPQRSLVHPQLLGNLFETTLGLLWPTSRRCTHLGCALHWNPQEHTWDCSCHGSRYAPDGKLLDNPALHDRR